MNVTKDQIKRWLGSHPDKDRQWIADLCKVEKRTVDNWLSSPRDIPLKAMSLITLQMDNDRQASYSATATPSQRITLSVGDEQFDNYNRASMSEDLTIRDWMTDTLNKAAKQAEDSKRMTPDDQPAITDADHLAETVAQIEKETDSGSASTLDGPVVE